MPREKGESPYSRLLKVDAFEPAPLHLLHESLEALNKPVRYAHHPQERGVATANIAAEIALHPDADNAVKVAYGVKAAALLNARHPWPNHAFVLAYDGVEPLRGHVPLIATAGTSNTELLQGLLPGLFRTIQSHNDYTSGPAVEMAVSLAALGLRRYGLSAYAAFARQDSNKARHSKFGRKSWDVTVESDGETIPKGRYPIEVKAYTPAQRNKYHPLITRVRGNILFDFDGDWRFGLLGFMSSALQKDEATAVTTIRTPDSVADRFLTYLAKATPVDEQLLLRPAEQHSPDQPLVPSPV